MSLWTPSGEHRVSDDRGTQTRNGTLGRPPADPDNPGDGESDVDADALRRQIAEAPADVVVANHCYGLFELAAVYLSDAPPRLEEARTAIDALGFLVDGLGERLGEAHGSLRDVLAQLRLAYVQISAAATGAGSPGPGVGPDGQATS